MQRVRQFWDRLRGAGDRIARPPTRLIFGLGNPGPKYADTRHNVGFRILDLLAAQYAGEWKVDRALDTEIARVEIGGEACILGKPQTSMNRSGTAMLAALERWPELDPTSDVLVVYDDMDLETGRIRLRPSGGAGGHRGIGDILERLESKQLPRLRFGVGHPGSSDEVIDWVLEGFSAAEESDLLAPALARATQAIEGVIRDGITVSMGQFNSE